MNVSCSLVIQNRKPTNRNLALQRKLAPPRLKRRRRVDPQQARFASPRISPSVRRRAVEIQTITGLQHVMLLTAEPDLEFAAQHVQKFLAFVRIRLAASAVGLDAKQMRLHCRVAPGE